MTQRALIFGAGGHAASAWEIGIVTGFSDLGIDVRNADLFVGTSAGARVAAQITSGLPLEELFMRQTDLNQQPSEAPPGFDAKEWRQQLELAKTGDDDHQEVLRRIGDFALTTASGSGSARRKFVASQLPATTWPEKKLLIATVEAESGERCVFDRNSGIDLVDAVTASGALAGVWPPVSFHGHHYIDGGFYSTENADLASDCDRVVILALRAGVPPLALVSLDTAIQVLRARNVRVEVVHPDKATEETFASVGRNLLDPAVAGPAARAGREQGRNLAHGHLATLWG